MAKRSAPCSEPMRTAYHRVRLAASKQNGTTNIPLWQQRSLKSKRYVYVWADWVYFNIRAENDRQCILVLIGVSDIGHKELLGLEAGFRESPVEWEEFAVALARPGAEPCATTGNRRWRFGLLESPAAGVSHHARAIARSQLPNDGTSIVGELDQAALLQVLDEQMNGRSGQSRCASAIEPDRSCWQ